MKDWERAEVKFDDGDSCTIHPRSGLSICITGVKRIKMRKCQAGQKLALEDLDTGNMYFSESSIAEIVMRDLRQ